MTRLLFTIFFLFQAVFSASEYFLVDTLNSSVDSLLQYDQHSKKFSTKIEKVKFFNDISFSLYDKTLNLQENTQDILIQYSALINNLEERLNLQKTSISYSLGAPSIDVQFKQMPVDRKNLKNNTHYNQLELLKEQYLELARFHHQIIDVCEKRVDELLSLLDKNAFSGLFNDMVLNKNIIVMNFNNISNSEKYDRLTSVFPEMIINRYSNRDDVTVTYSGSIEPDLRKVILNNTQESVRFLIDGSFFVDGFEIKINFKVYDINDWSLKTNQDLVCDIRDINCVYDKFLWGLKTSVDPLVKFERYDDFNKDINQSINRVKLDSVYKSKRNQNLFEPILEDFAVQKDYSFDINYRDMGIKESESIKTQAFDLSKYPNGIQTRKELLDDLAQKLDNFLSNPYKIIIGELKMDLNKNDNSYVDLSVPITYSFKKRDFEKMIKKMPYNTLKSNNKFYTIEFLNDNYLFDSKTINSFNNHQNELFPVLFFANKEGNIQKIIIDSWDYKYDRLLFGDYDVERIDNFMQLYSIIKSDDNMHFNINKGELSIPYNITMPISVLDNYTQLTVKIFRRSDLDAYLPINELKF
tara:strand:+ start:1490 stop:3235 length:1746 start_codon:yes stop_codon:yes gene_type:complete